MFLILSTDVNECTTIQPCMNEGRCVNLFGTYQCICKTGWMGKNCDQGMSVIATGFYPLPRVKAVTKIDLG